MVWLQSLVALVALAQDPEVTRILGEVAAGEGAARVQAVNAFVAGCKGRNRFAFRNNATALTQLRSTLADGDPAVRAAALGLTACFPGDALAKELTELTADADATVRERAYEEAAHASCAQVAAGLVAQVQRCGKDAATLDEGTARWCVFAVYALTENAQGLKDDALSLQAADLSVPLLASRHPKLREHALRTLGLFGKARHLEAMKPVLEGTKLSAEEKQQVQSVKKQLGKRK